MRQRTRRTPAPAHRLDRETSGLLACGCNPHATRRLKIACARGKVAKTYLALALGAVEKDRFTVAAALKLPGASGVRVRMHTAADGLPSVAEFEVLARRQTPNGEPLALHAWKLTLPHPGAGAPMSFEAPLAADLQAFWDGLVSPATARGNRPPT